MLGGSQLTLNWLADADIGSIDPFDLAGESWLGRACEGERTATLSTIPEEKVFASTSGLLDGDALFRALPVAGIDGRNLW